jgi:hypothetical protein
MSSGNRTVKYENLLKSLRKHYKPLAEPPERSVLEHLLYACCLEDARVEQADEGFAKLQQTYFDWNEVRVTTAVELAEALKPLPFPMQAASRIKQCLQSIFETRYQYDIDDMKKANLGKATAELEAWKGMSAFVVSYVSQHALGGHSIPASQLICEAMWQCDVLSLAEIQKKALPGIERAIPKNKGVEFAGLMHQFASDLYHHPKGTTPLAVLKEMGATYKTKPKADEPAATTKTKGSTAKAAPAAPGPAAAKEKESETKKPADTAAATPKSVAGLSSSKGKEEVKTPKTVPTAKATGTERPSGKESKAKEVPTASKAASKPAESAKELKPKEIKPIPKPAAKPSSSKSPAIKSDPAKADKGSKGKVEKGKSDTSKSDKAKPDKAKSDKGKADNGKANKGKAEKAKSSKPNVAKGKPEIAKSDKGKPVKKDSKGTEKPNKGSSKGSQGSVGTNLTKKKPR